MKQLERKDLPAVSGGEYAPNPLDGEAIPVAPTVPDYPQNPAGDAPPDWGTPVR